MSKIFKVPFAATGDKESVPTSTQPDGKVSYEQGFGHDYQKPYEDPEAKDIAREDFNQILFDITDAIGEAQVHGVSKWDDEGRPYPINALVYHDEKVWQSKVNNNNATPSEGANWGEVNISDLAKGVDVPLAGTGLEKIGRDFRVKYGTSAGTAVEGSTRVNGKALSGNVSINKADVGLGNVTNDTQAKAQTEIKAGAGLTGGGTLATNRTISVKFGTGSDDVARGNDSRITGALQKSQNLSDLASKSAARGNLGLGSAATRDVGTGSGNVMEVGAFGLGGRAPTILDLNDNTIPSGFYNADDASGRPSGVQYFGVFVLNRDKRPMQFGYDYGNNKYYVRTMGFSLSWRDWEELYHTGNFNPNNKANKGDSVIWDGSEYEMSASGDGKKSLPSGYVLTAIGKGGQYIDTNKLYARKLKVS